MLPSGAVPGAVLGGVGERFSENVIGGNLDVTREPTLLDGADEHDDAGPRVAEEWRERYCRAGELLAVEGAPGSITAILV